MVNTASAIAAGVAENRVAAGLAFIETSKDERSCRLSRRVIERAIISSVRSLHAARDSEASVLHADHGCRRIPVSGAEQLGIVIPRPAAQNAQAAVCGDDGGAVCRRAGIAVLVAVLHPLPDIAMHVVQPE